MNIARTIALFLVVTILLTGCAPRVSPVEEITLAFDPRGLITVNDARVQSNLKIILADKDDLRTDFRRVQDWVAGNIVYDTDIGVYWQWPFETLEKRKGDCKDYSTLLCTLWRASGVSASDVYVAIGQGKAGKRHAFLIQKHMGGKWQVVEPQVGGFILSDLGAATTAENYAITFLFNDIEYINKPADIYSRIKGGVTITSPPKAKQPLPVINSFTVDTLNVPRGGSAVLSWDVSGATYVGIDQGIGGVDMIGTAYVHPLETTEYRIAAMNDTGSVNAAVTVRVIPVANAKPYATGISGVEDGETPFMLGFAGWYAGNELVTGVNVGQMVTARVNLKGGSQGQYFLRVWRALNKGHDEIVMQKSFIFDGISAAEEITFSPSYTLGEAGTRGYWVDLQSDSRQVWTMPDTYPPRLTAAPRPKTGSLAVGFTGWYCDGNSITTSRKGQEITTGITLAGGDAGQYVLRIRRDSVGTNDEVVQEVAFDYDGSSTIQEIKFTPAYALEEYGTRGYYPDLYKDGKYLWSLSGSYPPGLTVLK